MDKQVIRALISQEKNVCQAQDLKVTFHVSLMSLHHSNQPPDHVIVDVFSKEGQLLASSLNRERDKAFKEVRWLQLDDRSQGICNFLVRVLEEDK